MVLYEIATCVEPYAQDVKTEDIPALVRAGGRPDVSLLGAAQPPARARLFPARRYRALLERCWHASPRERPTMAEVMKDIRQMFDQDEEVPTQTH